MPDIDTTPPAADPAPAPLRRRGLRRAGWALAGVLALLVVLVAAGFTWLWRSEPGTYWLLTQVPGLKIENWKGSLGGDSLTADRLTLDAGGGELVLEQVALTGLRWTWRPDAHAWAGIRMKGLAARSATWRSGPPSPDTPASGPPTDLRLPVELAVDELRVDRLQVDSLPQVTGLLGNLHLGAKGGEQHQVHIRQLDTDRFRFAGTASLETLGKMQLQSQLTLASLPGAETPLAWQASATLRGPLADLAAEGQLQGEAAAGQPAPQVAFQTRVQPFAAWPLGELALRTEALDLAALSSQAPRTRLRGTVTVKSSGLNQPAQAELDLHNDQPGRWDEQRLPMRQLKLSAAGTPQPLTELKLSQLAIEWANAQGSAGRWQGEGEYQLETNGEAGAKLTLQVQQFQPALLDARAPALLISGPLELDARPLPSLAQPAAAAVVQAAASAASAALTASAPTLLASPAASAASDAASPSKLKTFTLADTQLTLKAKLTGQLQGPDRTPPVSLVLDSTASLHQVTLKTLELKADTALASLTGQIERENERVRWKLAGQLQALDPRVWWPGAPDSEWRRAPQQINASLESDASLPESALKGAGDDPSVLWRALRGQLALKVLPSQISGVPVQGQLSLKNDDRQQDANAELQADDARIQAIWHDDPGATGRGQLTLKAPKLASLAPLQRLVPGAAGWTLREGTADVQVDLNEAGQPDRWQWRSEGRLQGVTAGPLHVDKAGWQGRGTVDADFPIDLTLNATQLSHGEARLRRLDASLQGSLSQHKLQLALDSPVQPPAWFLRVVGGRNALAGAKLTLGLEGRYTRTAKQGNDWAGKLSVLQVRAADGNGQDWLAAKDLTGTLHWEPDGRLSQARLAPGELVLPATALQWTEASYALPAAGQPPRIALQAKLRDIAMAPLLQRMQPEAVWSGDLKVGGQVNLRYDGRLDADVVVERLSGDLNLDEDGLLATTRTLPLGLSDLRLGLKVQNGAWQFTQGLAGQYLGALGAALTLNTTPDRLWPAPDSAMQGTMTLRITNLGAWAAWVPAGWRLGGEVASAAHIGGRLNAPEISGELNGQRLSVYNPLMGVQLTDGQTRLVLEGQRAKLETLRFKGGDGQISAQGEAQLGQNPTAKVEISAKRFRALGRIDRTVVASGDATLGLDKDALSLTGQVRVDEGLIDISRGDGPTLPEDVVMAKPPGEEEKSEEKADGQTERVTQLNVQVDLGQKLRLRGKGIDTGLQGALKITNPRGRMAVAGTVRTVGGNYAAYGQKLVIERGSILFTGPVDDPRLDIYAIRPNLDVRVGVAITGTALNPRVRLASDTEMSDTDKLSWLVMGRAPEGLGQADTALLQRAALALLMGDSGSPTDSVLDTIGLSDFSLRQATGENNVQTTVVTVGKQLSKHWYVGYERGVNATAGTWQLIYRVAQRFTVRAQSGEDSAIDAIWTWRWD